ncbi:uncharacterized protein PG986_000562 [Apiospora aurea]|uniref:FAD linked oxidase N-terminal domain-containing protein n=1 Tax=Apiospora aurea TaxID=335848 RepID=A0ABR1QW27_9PEZI
MYGMSPQRTYIDKALELLVPLPAQGLLVVFHREETLDVDGLVSHRTATFPEAFLSIDDDSETLDSFTAFVTGAAIRNDTAMGRAIQYEWRKVCRDLGRHDDGAHLGKLMFSTPEVMKAFTQHAVSLPKLTAKIPCVTGDSMVKNREACLRQAAAIIRPTEVQHIQECVRWATEHSVNLTIIGGGHGGQCIWSDTVTVDMDAFNHVDIVTRDEANEERDSLCRNEADLLWAIKGAGTNFGVVLSVTLRAFAAPNYSVRDWKVPLDEDPEAAYLLRKFDEAAKELPLNWSADAYLYGEADKMYLGDGIGLFETEMYRSGMHGGHIGGKTSLFKRCVFLKGIGSKKIANILISTMEKRPSLFCHLHLLHGGGAVRDVADNSTAFGCRDWDFACEVTGVWPRGQDGTGTARAAVRWVSSVVEALLPLSNGVYGADLGPDPRDAPLAIKAFGSNRQCLARLKKTFDPQNVLAYTCPILNEAPREPRLIVLVTGESGAGKDHCANLWACVFNRQRNLKARVTSISDAIKREYAATSGADLNRLLYDRAYKECRRPALTEFYENQLRKRPRLPEENFLDVVYNAANSEMDALLITGMRDEAPVGGFAHLVPDSRVVEPPLACAQPTFVFDNDATGEDEWPIDSFAERNLLPYFSEKLKKLGDMVRAIPDFLEPGIEFRHVLGIAQQTGGLELCTSLLQYHFNYGDWTKVDTIAACEAGGFVFASALAARVGVPPGADPRGGQVAAAHGVRGQVFAVLHLIDERRKGQPERGGGQ